MTAAELIRRGARQHADLPAVLFGEVAMSFAEVDELANRLAHGLALDRGTPVALLLGNGLHSIPLDFACAKAGLVRVPLNTRLAAAEQEEMLRITGATVLVHGADEAGRAAELAERLPLQLRPVAELDGASDDPGVDVEPDDPLLYIFTSGTTGRLKAVVHTQRTYAAICANILANLLDPWPGDVMLHAASLIHASGTFVLPFWSRGAAAAVLPGFVPPEFRAAIDRYGATHVNLVPTMLTPLLDLDPPGPKLHTVVYGASPMPRPLLERALERWGPRFVQYYGQTEAPLCISVLRAGDHDGELLGSCGQPAVDCELRLDLPTGEILVRAPFGAAGYLGDPDLHAETFLPDGWIRTRDIGRFDERGFLYLVDRTSDMIVTGGYNVYPREVEDALAAHPAVRECCVVGAPDERWVESVTAFVVADGEVDADELIGFCRERLAAYKAPKTVHFVDEIPKSPVGKLLRRALREPLWLRRLDGAEQGAQAAAPPAPERDLRRLDGAEQGAQAAAPPAPEREWSR
jgi:fatty-acyl-CoA synthase